MSDQTQRLVRIINEFCDMLIKLAEEIKLKVMEFEYEDEDESN